MLLRLLMAEIAVVLTLILLLQTPLSPFLPFFSLLLLVPLISVLFRNPFNLPLLLILLFLVSTPLLKNSEMFSAFLDVLYFSGYETFAVNLRNFFSLFPETDVFPYVVEIVTLYSISAILEGFEDVKKNLDKEGVKCEKFYISYVTSTVAPLLLSVLLFLLPLRYFPKLNIDPFLSGLLAVLLLALAVALFTTSLKR